MAALGDAAGLCALVPFHFVLLIVAVLAKPGSQPVLNCENSVGSGREQSGRVA